MSDVSPSTEHDLREEEGEEGPMTAKKLIKGGSSGLAAAIRSVQQQGEGLRELKKSSVSKQMRMERSLSTQEGDTKGPFKSGRSTQRLYSVPDEFDTQTQSNGDIPRKTPFLPPPSALSTNQNRDNSAQCPPPKPPRTGSTSPSAFLSLDRGVELEEPFEESDEEYYDQEGEEDMSQSSGEVAGEYQVEEIASQSDQQASYQKRPMLPPSVKGDSASSSNGTPDLTPSASPAIIKREAKTSPKVPMLPPTRSTSKTPSTRSTSKTPPTPQKTTPTSSKQSPKPASDNSVNSNGNRSNFSSVSESEEPLDVDLKRENELLRQRVLALQQKIKSQPPFPPGASKEMSKKDSSRPRSRSMSPCEEEDRDRFPSGEPRPTKPFPLPRKRTQTVNNEMSGRSSQKSSIISPPPSAPATVGFVLPDNMKSDKTGGALPVFGSDSPTPKPRSNSKPIYPPMSKIGTGTSEHTTTPIISDADATRPNMEDKRNVSQGVGKRSISSSPVNDDVFRTESEASDISVQNSEKAKAVITLKKLLPSIPRQASTETVSTSSVQSSSTSQPIPVLRNPSSSENRETKTVIEINRDQVVSSSTESSSQSSRNQKPDPVTPLSSSIPPPSLLSKSEPKGERHSAQVKAQLNSVAAPVPYSAGRAKYKKVILSDSSWMKRKESLNEETAQTRAESTAQSPTLAALSNNVPLPSTTTATIAINSNSGSGIEPRMRPPLPNSSPGSVPKSNSAAVSEPPSKPLPYRSHAILTGPKPVQQSFIPSTSPNLPHKDTAFSSSGKVSPSTKPAFNRDRTDTASSGNGGGGKKKFWGKTSSNETKKITRRFSFTRSTSNDEITPLRSDLSKGKDKSGGKSKKSVSQSQVAESSPKRPPRANLGAKKGDDFRPVSMMVNNEKSELTASMSSSSMPRGIKGDEVFKQKKRGLFGRKKKNPAQASPPEEPANGSDSGSDDEKGGTIKKMPKLRHVAVKRQDMGEDDGEPEYHQLFEYVFVVSLKEESKGKLTTEMTYTFPPTSREFSGKDIALKSIPQFCFPDIDQWKPTKSYKSESFSFVLTDMEGNRRFGYCRRLLPSGSGARLPEVFCIVSPLGCFSLYEDILDHVEERRAISKLSVFNFLKAISANPFPRPGRSVEVKVFGAQGSDMEVQTFTRPLDSRLEHVNFSLLFSTLKQRKIIQLFSSLLMERRVIFCASSLSLMTGCAHALMALLYPFEWQHVFIPVLPSSLIDFVCSPLPYIIGINPSSCRHFDEMDMEEAVVINLDKGKFVRKIGDESSILPSKLFQFLEGKLSASIISSEYSKRSIAQRGKEPCKADEIVVNTFMTFFAYLYGDYHDALSCPVSGYREFQRADYIKRFSSKSTRRFLEAFHMTQMFEHFIEQRENCSKAETLAASLFEKKLPELKDRCQDIEIFSSKSRIDRWKMKKDMAKGH